MAGPQKVVPDAVPRIQTFQMRVEHLIHPGTSRPSVENGRADLRGYQTGEKEWKDSIVLVRRAECDDNADAGDDQPAIGQYFSKSGLAVDGF